MGKLEKILEIVSLIFGVFYYICEYATKKSNESFEGQKDVRCPQENCSTTNEEVCISSECAKKSEGRESMEEKVLE